MSRFITIGDLWSNPRPTAHRIACFAIVLIATLSFSSEDRALALTVCSGTGTGDLTVPTPWTFHLDTSPPRCAPSIESGGADLGNQFTLSSDRGSLGINSRTRNFSDFQFLKFSNCTIESIGDEPSEGINTDWFISPVAAELLTFHCGAGTINSTTEPHKYPGASVVFHGSEPDRKNGKTYKFEQTVTDPIYKVVYIVRTTLQLIDDLTFQMQSITIEGGVFGADNERMLIIQSSGRGTGTVVGKPDSSINCQVTDGSQSGICHQSVETDTSITVKATPAEGTEFGGWNGACDNEIEDDPDIAGNETCEHTMGESSKTLTPIFKTGFDADRTSAAIRHFMMDRAGQIVAGDISRAGRLSSSPGGNGNGSNGSSGNGGSSSSGTMPFTVSGSLVSSGLYALGARGAGISPLQNAALETSLKQVTDKHHAVDVWMKARYARMHNGEREADFGLISMGVDRLVSPDLLIGGLVQVDLFDHVDNELDAKTKGVGWMAGPYMVARLSDRLLFEGRAAWGQSRNEITPLDSYTDTFETERWLVKAALVGDFTRNNWHISPALSAFWFEGMQQEYTDSQDILIPDQTVSLGQLTFGPSFSRTFLRPSGMSITPSLSVDGVWDFHTTDDGTSESAVRARAKTGLAITGQTGLSVKASGHVEGLGSDDIFSYGGELEFSVPLP